MPPDRDRSKRPRIRRHLWLLVFACTLPLLLLITVREVDTYNDAVERAQEHTLETARALRFALDRELDGRIQTLQALSLSRRLDTGDLAAFRDQAERFLTIQPPGSSIVLSDADGRQLLNTNLAAGTPLPRRGSMEPVERIFSTGKPFVSGLFTAAGTGRPTLGVEVPVFRDGRIAYDLTLSLPLRMIQDLIRSQALPEDWTVSVFDQHDVHLVREPEPDRFVGAGPGAALRDIMADGDEGSGRTTTLAGVPAFTVFSRSELSSWSVVISVPRAVLQRQLQWSLAGTVFVWALLALTGVLVASRLSRSITGPIRSLVDMAEALGRGELPPRPPATLREVDQVAETLAASALALRGSEERLRLAQQAGRVGHWDLDFAAGRMWWSGSMYRLAGLEPREEGLSLAEVLAIIHPDDRDRAAQAGRAAIEGHQPYDVEVRLLCGDGTVRWVVSRGEIARDVDGRPLRFIGVNMDVTDRREAEERQRLLIQEVDHRAKNALAVVQALVRLTPPDVPERFAAAIEGRLAALARAHTLLAESRWSGVRLRELMEQELGPYIGELAVGEVVGVGHRVTLAGPEVVVAPNAAQPLSMMLHELTTNAAKYGSLSVAEGRLEVVWGFDDAGHRFELTWQETDGPPMTAPPARSGFGSTLLGMSARQLRGTVGFDWSVAGLRCLWSLPAGEFIEGRAARSPAAAPETASPAGEVKKDLRVLAVEDDALVSLSLTMGLEAMGYRPIAATSLAEAVRLAEEGDIAAAVLDVNLHGEMVFPAAEILDRRGVPFLFATAYGEIAQDGRWNGVPALRKPYSQQEMGRVLAALLERRPAGPVQPSK